MFWIKYKFRFSFCLPGVCWDWLEPIMRIIAYAWMNNVKLYFFPSGILLWWYDLGHVTTQHISVFQIHDRCCFKNVLFPTQSLILGPKPPFADICHIYETYTIYYYYNDFKLDPLLDSKWKVLVVMLECLWSWHWNVLCAVNGTCPVEKCSDPTTGQRRRQEEMPPHTVSVYSTEEHNKSFPTLTCCACVRESEWEQRMRRRQLFSLVPS